MATALLEPRTGAANAPTRRNILAVLAAGPLVAAVAPPLVEPLEALFASWKVALYRLNNDGGDEEYDAPLWDGLNAAEDEIIRCESRSPRVAAMRLWIALQCATHGTGEANVIAREDIATFVRGMASYDWEVKCQIQALSALVGYGKAH